ncbi:MAG: IcmT/TraK family protein [Alphaproteobacteria bacterium]|nr:IcmT/TraK family protein [Alphaproteobacteria bacterium]
MDIHWRNSQKPIRFFMLDARSFLSVVLFLFHARLWTLVLALIVMLVFWVMEQRGLTFESSLRAIRCWLLGRNRPANSRLAVRRWTDFGE